MISDTEYTRAVAEFLKQKGVTRCPTVCLAPTRASVSDADRVALRSHAEIREAVRRARRREMQQIVSARGLTVKTGGSSEPALSFPCSAVCVSP
ncbi:MAG: hypothetical protein AB7H90_24350 [Alphaproteobacteria bacterium]